MKKILTALLLLVSMALVSCNNNTKDDTKRMDVPSNALITELKLESVKSGKTIKEIDTTKTEYYSIKIAEDAYSTLFAYNTSLDATIAQHEENGEKLQSFSVNPLTFTGEITSTETTQIINEIFDLETGITKEVLGVSFEIKVMNAWTATLDASSLLEAYRNDQRDNYLSVIYLPTLVEHISGGKSVLEAYVMVPVYYEFTTIRQNVNSSDTVKEFPVQELTFNENNLLPSNE